MLALTIKDTKNFMSQLLIKNVFDSFYLSEASIKTANSYVINGEVNRDFFTGEEFEQLSDKKYSRWTSIKPFCFNLIKGSKVPSFMKIVFVIPDEMTSKLISESGADFSVDSINGLFLNIRYTDGVATVVTGVSLNIFTMDKSLEHYFDSFIKGFLFEHKIDFEEQS